MRNFSIGTEFLVKVTFVVSIICITQINETSSVSLRFPIRAAEHSTQAVTSKSTGLKKSGRSSSSKTKKKKVLQVSKQLFNKIKKNQARLESAVSKEAYYDDDEAPAYKYELYGNPDNSVGESKQPLPSVKNMTNELDLKIESTNPKNILAYYCPPYNSGVDREGRAIIEADPNDCACYYYCSWGVHYVQCCSWPLLWNDKIKTCDWYWSVQCATENNW